MRFADIPWQPEPKVLRQFSGLLVLFGLGLSSLGYWNGREGWMLWAPLGFSTIGVIGWIQPAWVKWLFVGWMIAVFPIGWVVSRILLVGLFLLVFLPIGLVLRFMGWDPLGLKSQNPSQTSFWRDGPGRVDAKRYLRQY